MAALQDIEAEGVTAFAPPPATTYRYTITLQDDTLGILMEDRATKKQWYRGSMDESDYVSAENAVTDATPADYAKCFRDALDCELDQSGDLSRDLEFLDKGPLRLRFSVRLRGLHSSRVLAYSFELAPVSVERIDALEAKLRDQQHELERLRRQVHGGRKRTSIHLDASSKDVSSSNLLLQTPPWQEVDSNFTVDEKRGEVRVCHAGEYSISVVADASANGYNPVTSLVKNSNVLQYDSCSCVSNRKVYLDQDDVVTVKCDSDVTSACHVSFLRLRR